MERKRQEAKFDFKRGDIWLADLGGTRGSEQGGERPVVIIQNNLGNKFAPTLIVAPITSKMTKAKMPTHVELTSEDGLKHNSVILMEQIRTIDKTRLVTYLTKLSSQKMAQVGYAIDISLGRDKERELVAI